MKSKLAEVVPFKLLLRTNMLLSGCYLFLFSYRLHGINAATREYINKTLTRPLFWSLSSWKGSRNFLIWLTATVEKNGLFHWRKWRYTFTYRLRRWNGLIHFPNSNVNNDRICRSSSRHNVFKLTFNGWNKHVGQAGQVSLYDL